ncbi:xanthine dehydrogenase family protein molybdopterin-binding subunit [Rugosimonospora africana]|uniref:Carbon-monoxide dehydrogenase large subunit n=1 Tax=Rugosimonospora africana TaxID=556532 RepID=A0A8J3VSS8_9ACTN|nr:xanthine dehydrogenase family protein molybdopterin-binding subunit [Rugosimonospora africana]GIH17682.1 carbon-monoxide dehydrogenase large subunit [Rugosimonospora africana]
MAQRAGGDDSEFTRRAADGGSAPSRREDARLVRGAGCFVADLLPEDCLEVVFVSSPVAHGEMGAVDVDDARRMPGVAAVWSAADLPAVPQTPPMLGITASAGRAWPALAVDRVRYVGQPVAIVLAADRYVAEDARDAVRLDISPLPVLLDPTDAAGSEVELFLGMPNVAVEKEYGDPIDPAVWRDAAVVVEGNYRQQLLAHTSMEARAILIRPEDDDGLTVWCSHQAPHRLRGDLAAALGLPEERIRVVVPDVGGAFGGKSETYPEYLAVAVAARRLGRTVRWVEDRAEALTGPPHGRGQNQRTRMAADADGRILAYELTIDADVGGYPHLGAFVPLNTSVMAAGAYQIPRVHVQTRCVVTNTAPTSPYRGAGRPEAATAIERTVDTLARRLGMDPAKLRQRNFIRPDALPYRTPTGFQYDSGDYPAALALAMRTVDYDGWRAQQAQRRRTGTGAPLGIGICSYLERSGNAWEFGSVEACPDGTYLALSGCCSTGQGHETSFPQVVASVLGVEPELIRLVEADTAIVPRGIGSYSSRSMQTGGAALHRAAGALMEQARGRAAESWAVPIEEVTYRAGTVSAGQRRVSLADLAAATGPLRADEVFEPPQAAPYGTYIAVVEVEPELGTVSVLRLVAVDDYGVVINHVIVRGQSYGSIAQGLGQALYEQVRYDPDGVPETRSLLDYLIPTLSEVPPVTLREMCTPNPNTALGAKGAGEAGCIGAPAAVINAVVDALDLDDPSAIQMPLTPFACWQARQPALAGAGR